MRRHRILLALALTCSMNVSFSSLAKAVDKPAAEASKESREKFAKLLLPEGSKKSVEKPAAKRRGVVVNAFVITRVIIH